MMGEMYQWVLVVVAALMTVSCRAGYPRSVTKVLTVTNGKTWGGWSRPEFCPTGTYAKGFELKVERSIGKGDDTALNAIALQCGSSANNNYQGIAKSHPGPWGAWSGVKNCMKVGDISFFLTAFQLRVEPSQGNGDDTAANNIKFKCKPLTLPMSYPVEGNGMTWGGYGGWSAECPAGSAICGLQTRVEPPIGKGDDTALNDVKFFCCNK